MIINPDMVDQIAGLIFDSSFGCAAGDFKRHLRRSSEGAGHSAQLVQQSRARAILILAKVAEMTNQDFDFTLTTRRPANDTSHVPDPPPA